MVTLQWYDTDTLYICIMVTPCQIALESGEKNQFHAFKVVP